MLLSWSKSVVMSIDQPLQQPLQAGPAKLMSWVQDGLLILPNLVIALLVLIVCWASARVVSAVVQRVVSRLGSNRDAVRLLGFLAYAALLAGGVFVALGVLHLDKTVTSLLTGGGLLGPALGLALPGVASNLMAGLPVAPPHSVPIHPATATHQLLR